MLIEKPRPSATVGFLTVVEHEEAGWLGGYLVLNQRGRPVEFQCTAPVKPNRAQEILYGPTLRPFMYGERIGSTLINKSTTKPQLIITDVAPVLSVRDSVEMPICLVDTASTDDCENPSGSAREAGMPRLDSPHDAQPVEPKLVLFSLGANQLGLETQYSEDQQTITRRWEEMQLVLDLAEPFERIHQALAEAHQEA